MTVYLTNHDFTVLQAKNGRQALLHFEHEQPDLMLPDVILPDMNGFEVCRTIRRQSMVPIVFVNCKWETEDIVQGLEPGGDDYITKPFVPQELLARIKANLRNSNSGDHREALNYGPLHIDLRTYQVTVNDKPVSPSAKELQLLLFLARNPNQVFDVDTLLTKVWGAATDSDTSTVMVHISNLRRKIEPDHAKPRRIQTVRGFGYLFNPK